MDERTSALKTAEEQKRQAEDSKTLAEDRGKEADRMRGIAQAQTNEARRQAAIALSRQLAAQSIRNFNEFPVKSLLLAVESTSTTSKKYNYPTPAAEEALRDALSQAGGILIRGHEAAVTSVAFSPDGRRLPPGRPTTPRGCGIKEPSAKRWCCAATNRLCSPSPSARTGASGLGTLGQHRAGVEGGGNGGAGGAARP